MKYFLVSKKIFDNSKVGMYGKVLYAVLCKFANSRGECYPSRKTLAKRGGFSVSTYNKYIARLLDENFASKTSRWRKNMSQTSNLFKVSRKPKNCFKVRGDIFELGLSPAAIVVYIYLSMLGDEDNCCRISQRIISRCCAISISSVIRAAAELRSRGLLKMFRQNNVFTGGNYVLLYHLTNGTEFKNVNRKRVDYEEDKNKLIYRCPNVIEKRLNISSPADALLCKLNTPPMYLAHPLNYTYIKYILEKGNIQKKSIEL